jgi:dihydroorotate dehydrogenase (NAD+) catalytic subunit
VKLSPNVADLGAIARAAEQAGADALVAINTVRALAVDRDTGAPLLGGPGGGLSGPAVRPVALAAVRTMREASALPIVGMGGVERPEDAYALLAAGASLVAVGTALFRNAALAGELRAGLARLISRRGWPGDPQALPIRVAANQEASSGA